MKLYFYRIEGDALSCVEAEARETPKLYIATQGTFPNCVSRFPKGQIGRIDNRWLVLDSPGEITARAIWRQYLTESAEFYKNRADFFSKEAANCQRIVAALDETTTA